VIAITHYRRLLEVLVPDFVHVLVRGEIVASGGRELVDELERDGYAAYLGDHEQTAELGSYLPL
jgi:Fe-S cluster assembly ATP-binding protein